MRSIKVLLIFTVILLNGSMAAWGQDKVALVPLDDELTIPVVIKSGVPENPVYLDEAFPKPIIFNKGWDQNIGFRTKLEPTVQIEFIRREPVFGYPGIIFTANEIRQWGLQRFFIAPKDIYAKAVLMIDKGDTIEGGPFEWSLNKQGFMSFHNVVRTDSNSGWIRAWTDPRPGDTVYFFIMSDDEQFASNPIEFIW